MVDGPDGAGGEPPALPGALPGTLQNILGRARVVITPYPFGVSDADNLRIVAVNSAPGITIELHGRQAIGGFESKPFRFAHTPNSNRTATTEDFVLGAGLVTNLSVFAAGGAPLIGQTFVIIQLVRSMGSVAYVMGTLLSGYVTATQGLGWPGSAIQSSIEGGGYYRSVLGTTPAAGAEIVETVPAGARWELLSLRASLVTSGAAGNRFPNLALLPGAALVGVSLDPNGLAPSTSFGLIWGVNLPVLNVPASFSHQLPLHPSAILLAGGQFLTNTPGLAAGDQWTAPTYLVREWLEAA